MSEHSAGYNEILKKNFKRLCDSSESTAIKLSGYIKESGKDPRFEIIVVLPRELRDHFADELEDKVLKQTVCFRQHTTDGETASFTIPLKGNSNKKIKDLAEVIKNTLENFGKTVPELITNFSQGNFNPVNDEVKSYISNNGNGRGHLGIT